MRKRKGCKFALRAMFLTKLKETMKKVVKELWQLWKSQTGWDRQTTVQKIISCWWSLSFVGLGLSSGIILSSVAVANIACSSYFLVKYVPEPEED